MWNIASEHSHARAPTSHCCRSEIFSHGFQKSNSIECERIVKRTNTTRSKHPIVNVNEVGRHTTHRQIRFKSRSKSVRQLRIFFCLLSFSFNFINSTGRSFFFFLRHRLLPRTLAGRCFCPRYLTPNTIALDALFLFIYRIAVVVLLHYPACELWRNNSQPNAFSTTTHMAIHYYLLQHANRLRLKAHHVHN